MKHIINTDFRFDDDEKLKNYLPLLKEYALKSIKSQSNKNFTWVIWLKERHIDILNDVIDVPFYNLILENKYKYGFPDYHSSLIFHNFLRRNNVEIQTKLDADDVLYPHYVETIQEIYEANKDKYKSFIINALPIMNILATKKYYHMNMWNEQNISMIFSLCAKHYDGVFLERDNHAFMYKLVEKVIMAEPLGEYIIHGNNRYAKDNMDKLLPYCTELP